MSTDKSSEIKSQVSEKIRVAANEGKAKTGEAANNISKMIEDSAATIDKNIGEKYGNYARSAAGAVSSFGERLNSKEVDELVDDARNFVRKSPAVAIGAAAAIGFVISRLIKSGASDKD